MKIQQIIDIIEHTAPLDLAEQWDNCGLQAGSGNGECSGAFLTLDVTMDTVLAAKKCGANLIISHHPLIFDPIKSVTDTSKTGNIIYEAIKNGIAIYSSHTPFDICVGGINDYLAEKLELVNVLALSETGLGRVGNLKDTLSVDKFIAFVKEALELRMVRVSSKIPQYITKVALCGGSGASLLNDAVNSDADVFITGDIKYHNFIDSKISIIDVGHFESEKQFITLIDALISKKITTFASHVDLSNPTQIK